MRHVVQGCYVFGQCAPQGVAELHGRGRDGRGAFKGHLPGFLPAVGEVPVRLRRGVADVGASFGSGFGAVLVPLAVLLAFGTAANLLAARFFRA